MNAKKIDEKIHAFAESYGNKLWVFVGCLIWVFAAYLVFCS